MYTDLTVEAMVQERERARNQHVAEGHVLRALVTAAQTAPVTRAARPKLMVGQWFAWLQRAPRRAAATA